MLDAARLFKKLKCYHHSNPGKALKFIVRED